MPGFFGLAPTPPRTAELWTALLARLASNRMVTILGGAGRVKLATAVMDPEGGEGEAWGRLVVAPVRRAFGEPDEGLGRSRVVAFLIRTEVHSPGPEFDPTIPLEAAQNEAFELVHGWVPGEFDRLTATLPAWREVPPQTLPLWDDATGLWFLSSEYRVRIAPA